MRRHLLSIESLQLSQQVRRVVSEFSRIFIAVASCQSLEDSFVNVVADELDVAIAQNEMRSSWV